MWRRQGTRGFSISLHAVILLTSSFCCLNQLVLGFSHNDNHNMDASHSRNSKNKQHPRIRKRRDIPEKVLIGYAVNCDEQVKRAVREGVNVVVWAFMNIIRKEEQEQQEQQQRQQKSTNDDDKTTTTTIAALETNSLDLDSIRKMIQELDEEGFTDTVHLVAFGGWNGPHLDPNLTAQEWYQLWKEELGLGEIFHGIDWDPEGHDNLDSPTNYFTTKCLDKIGTISRLAHSDGYIVTMAPAQSYLDIDSSNFSRSVKLKEPNRPWHSEFHYFGANIYAYILSRYGDSIDLVSMQFYESYSRAAMDIYHYGTGPEEYLQSYVKKILLHDQEESYFVDFSKDEELNYPSQPVSLPLSKLVWGFANGWAANEDDEKVVYFTPDQIRTAYNALIQNGIATPKGFMFWVIQEEGNKGIQYAKELNEILRIRKSSSSAGSGTGDHDKNPMYSEL